MNLHETSPNTYDDNDMICGLVLECVYKTSVYSVTLIFYIEN